MNFLRKTTSLNHHTAAALPLTARRRKGCFRAAVSPPCVLWQHCRHYTLPGLVFPDAPSCALGSADVHWCDHL